MKSYLLERTQKISAQGQLSNALPVFSGVPQGSVLGPILLLLFINDHPAICLDAIPWLFADDSKLLFNAANFHDELTRLPNWNLSNGMLANIAKTKALNFKSVTDINVSGIDLMNVNSQRNLGVLVTSNLKWDILISGPVRCANFYFFWKIFFLGAGLRRQSRTSIAAWSYLSFSMEPSSVLQVFLPWRKRIPSKNFAFGGFLEKSWILKELWKLTTYCQLLTIKSWIPIHFYFTYFWINTPTMLMK